MADQAERRRWPRFALHTSVDFRRKRETHYTIDMHDLTPQGCRIAPPERLDPGELVWVQLPSLESLAAQVKWTSRWQSGVEFERPMHTAVYDMMTARLAPAAA